MVVAVGKDQEVLQAQLESLDATDCYASAWSDALALAEASAGRLSWGGRGRGGRGIARRPFQPRDIVVDGVCLEYVNDASVTGGGGAGRRSC